MKTIDTVPINIHLPELETKGAALYSISKFHLKSTKNPLKNIHRYFQKRSRSREDSIRFGCLRSKGLSQKSGKFALKTRLNNQITSNNLKIVSNKPSWKFWAGESCQLSSKVSNIPYQRWPNQQKFTQKLYYINNWRVLCRVVYQLFPDTFIS